MRYAIFCFIAFLFGAGLNSQADAHALEPGYLELRQFDDSLYAVSWKKPAIAGAPMAIAVQLPAQCDVRTEGELFWDGTAYYSRWTANCEGGIEGGEVRIDGLEQTSTDVLVRFDFANGATGTQRLTPTSTSFVLPSQPDRLDVMHTYLSFGVEHILGGFDHLLFVLALLLLVKGLRRIIVTVTAFTVAHSITLVAATLGWVHLPGPPIEATIALSIAFVAAEILRSRQGRTGLTERYPWSVAFTFGLLHGFGFAGALTEVGLPQTEIPIALLFFNVGVEVGQLMFIAVAGSIYWLLRRSAHGVNLLNARWVTTFSAYAIGSLAMFWVVERTTGFFG